MYDYMHPAIFVPLMFILWGVVLVLFFRTQIDDFFAHRRHKRRMRKMRKYATQDLAATQEVFIKNVVRR